MFLGDICDIINGRSQKLVEATDGHYPIYGSGGVMGRANAFLCKGGSTVIGRKGTINRPIFVNEDLVLRPVAGKRIMDQFLDANSRLTVSEVQNLSAEDYEKLEKMSMDFAYDTFVELKEKQLQKNQESYNKYMYALQLRTEAADHIGIENIRRSRLQRLEKEREDIERSFKKGKQVYPDFRLSLLVRLEA